MERTHTDILKGLVSAGVRWRYGEKADNLVKRRIVWELMHIIKAEYVDYYLMAFWVFKYSKQDINYWARGVVSSSIVCYCLGLTEVDPIRYGLHSARFVNEEPPKFQFDVEALRFDEFMKRAEEILQANAKDFDIPTIRECLFKDVKPCEYLNKKQERPLPEDLEDEFARYALYFPQTMDLFCDYVNRFPMGDVLIYQEQMLDILKGIFHLGGIKANQIRISIQRDETEQVEAYRQELFASSDLPHEEKEKAWQLLTSNPKAFLKAHAVSRVLASYKYEMPEGFIKKWTGIGDLSVDLTAVRDENGKWGFIDLIGKVVLPFKWACVDGFSEGLAAVMNEQRKWGYIDRSGELVISCQWKRARWFREGLAQVMNADGRWGFIDKTGNLVLPCLWKKALWFSEGLAGVQDDNEKWGFIDKTGKVVLPFVWSNVQWFKNGRVRVQTVLGGGWHDIDREGNDVQ